MNVIPLLLASALLVAPLPAHATVVGTNPADGATLTEAVDSFSVTVNEDILQVEGVDTSNIITIRDAAGLYYGDGCTTVDGDTIAMAAGLGEPGAYSMEFALVSADGHQINDTVSFTWAPAGEAVAMVGSETAPVCGETTPEAAAPVATPISAPATEEPPAESSSAEASAPAVTQIDEDVATPEQNDGIWTIVIAALVALAVIGAVIAIIIRTRRNQNGYGSSPDQK